MHILEFSIGLAVGAGICAILVIAAAGWLINQIWPP